MIDNHNSEMVTITFQRHKWQVILNGLDGLDQDDYSPAQHRKIASIKFDIEQALKKKAKARSLEGSLERMTNRIMDRVEGI